jgi:hypothetical protein
VAKHSLTPGHHADRVPFGGMQKLLLLLFALTGCGMTPPEKPTTRAPVAPSANAFCGTYQSQRLCLVEHSIRGAMPATLRGKEIVVALV